MTGEKLLALHDDNWDSLAGAIKDAGGEPTYILSQHRQLLYTLAMNDIQLTATCLNPKDRAAEL